MSKKTIVERVEEISAPIVEALGLELVDVEYIKEGQNWFLRLYIDKENGINIDDCEKVSEKLNKILDDIDIIDNAYFFEVSSPGLEKSLKKDKEFEKYKGQLVEVKLYKPIEKVSTVEGELIGLIDGKIVLNINGKETSFEKQDVSLVKRVFKI